MNFILRELLTTGSVVHINDNYDQVEDDVLEHKETKRSDYIGQPVPSIEELEKQLTQIDQLGFVKKKILEAGGGLPLDKKFTISFAFSGFWENSEEPFDYARISKPLVCYIILNQIHFLLLMFIVLLTYFLHLLCTDCQSKGQRFIARHANGGRINVSWRNVCFSSVLQSNVWEIWCPSTHKA